MKNIFILSLVCLFSGCFLEQKQNYKPVPKQEPIKQQIPQKQSIKGIIDKIYYENGSYFYEIRATDTANNKLEFAKARVKNPTNSKGDLVYAIIFNDEIIDISTIKKSTQISDKIIRNDKKRDKSKNIISLPKVEKLDF